MSNELFNQKYVDINLNPDIEEKIENILYNIIKKRTDNDEIEQNNIKEHLKIDFETFNPNNKTHANLGFNRNIISSEISVASEKNRAWFLSNTPINKFRELSNEENIMNIHEIFFDKKKINSMKKGEINLKNGFEKNGNKITEDKLKNLKHKTNNKGYIKSGSRNGDLGKKRERDYSSSETKSAKKKNKSPNKINSEIPIGIQNLITQLKQKLNNNNINFNIYEKYKAYKKLNSNDYKKLNK